jgi:hypothetical protein
MKQSIGAKTLAMPTPVWLVGTYDAKGKPNIMTAVWDPAHQGCYGVGSLLGLARDLGKNIGTLENG